MKHGGGWAGRRPPANRIRNLLASLLLFGLLGYSSLYVASGSLRDTKLDAEGVKVIRVAHSLNDAGVQSAFAAIARDYEARNPNVRIVIQSVPKRAYDQWVNTQLMGGTAPDLVQVLGTWGLWSNLAQQYLTPLSSQVEQTNPHNHGTEWEGKAWKASFVDDMYGGYFGHLMEFYGVPVTLTSQRVIFNKTLYRQITGRADPPETFEQWMAVCDLVRRHNRDKKTTIVPIIAAQEDVALNTNLFGRYFPSLTAGMTDKLDAQLWATPLPVLTLYGLFSRTLSFRDERIRRAFELLRDISRNFQPSFLTDRADQKRFYFLQGKGLMTFGETRDFAVYKQLADFAVGVMNFPVIAAKDPTYGAYYRGPVRDNLVSPLAFGLTATSKHPEASLDFLKFCTSVGENEKLCRALSWLPVVRGAKVAPEIETFAPSPEGVVGYPALTFATGGVTLYFEQNFPAFLGGHLGLDAFLEGFAAVWLRDGPATMQREIDGIINNIELTEYNLSKAKVKMLFSEAGVLTAGSFNGIRSPYEMGLEIVELLDRGNVARLYTWQNLQNGSYPYPLRTVGKTPP